MKTVSISKKAIAMAGTFVLAAVVFFATLIPSPQAQAAPAPDGLLPTITLSVGIPTTVTLPPIFRTVTKQVTSVVTLPRATTTVTVPGAGTVRTVQVQQPARTVIVNAPANPQVVKTVTVTQTAGQNGQRNVTLPPVTQTVTATSTGTPRTVPGANVTTTVTKNHPVVITRIQAVFSALALAIIGAIAGMLVLGAYRLGWFRGDAGNREFLEETVDDLKYNK